MAAMINVGRSASGMKRRMKIDGKTQERSGFFAHKFAVHRRLGTEPVRLPGRGDSEGEYSACLGTHSSFQTTVKE